MKMNLELTTRLHDSLPTITITAAAAPTTYYYHYYYYNNLEMDDSYISPKGHKFRGSNGHR